MKTLKSIASVLILTLAAIGTTGASDRPAGGGGGGNIVVFDIVDSIAQATTRSDGGSGGVGGDIIVFDIVDS